jgi:hypothetical protein
LQTIIHFAFRKGLKEKLPDPWNSMVLLSDVRLIIRESQNAGRAAMLIVAIDNGSARPARVGLRARTAVVEADPNCCLYTAIPLAKKRQYRMVLPLKI